MKKKSNAGRKQAIIDWDIVDELLEADANGVQIAAVLGIHADTLYRHVLSGKKIDFAAYSQQKRAKGDAHLLNAQYRKALDGKDNNMLIWLGKNRLNQRDDPKDQETCKPALMVYFDWLKGLEKPLK